MEDLFEFLIELLFDGAIEGSKYIRFPKWLRLLLLTVPFAVITVLFGLVAYELFISGPFWAAMLMAAIALAAVIGYIVLARRIIKGIPRRMQKDEPVGNENPDEE